MGTDLAVLPGIAMLATVDVRIVALGFDSVLLSSEIRKLALLHLFKRISLLVGSAANEVYP